VTVFEIGGRPIGPQHPPFIIAEMSANHGGDLGRAKRIIRMAAEAGADSIKFQAYTAASLTLDLGSADFVIEGESLWTGRKLFDLYDEAATPYEWFPELFADARQHGIIPFASPFDKDAVAMLESLDCPAYKIASFEAVDVELITACAETGKPVIISTGMCNEGEIDDAVMAARNAGCKHLALLKCTSSYPAPPEAANLLSIPAMEEKYDLLIGLSDHTLGSTVAVAGCALGATLVEKHFIDAREPATPDSAFSIDSDELVELIANCRIAHAARGQVLLGQTSAETNSTQFRRSLYVVQDIAAGDELTRENVRSIRPGFGLAPINLPKILGRHTKALIHAGTPLSWDLFD
jgi:pseudaminic acid synthase